MKNDLVELSNILDEHIEKGEALATKDRMRGSSRIDQYEEVLQKGLTFDPFNPRTMNEDSQYYNPYMQHPGGGFMPHPVESWMAQGKGEAGYETVKEFYRVTGDAPMDEEFYRPRVVAAAQSRSQFARFAKSLASKPATGGGKVAVGTVHTHSDGQSYKKVAEGRWAPVASNDSQAARYHLGHKDPAKRQVANDAIEGHAQKKAEIEGLIKQKKRDDEVVGRAKNEAVQAAASHTQNLVSKLYDGKVPKHVAEETNKIRGEHGADLDPKATLEKEGQKLKPKVHNVGVKFTHQGKEYSHKFEGVHGGSHQEAISRVQEILKKKLPGHQLTSVRAETPKEVATKPSPREAKA
jgi:hypothetical protein